MYSYMFTQEQLKQYALEKYPVVLETVQNLDGVARRFDINKEARDAFIEGYDLSANLSVQETDDQVNEAYYRARKEILSKLPKWKKADRDIFVDSIDYAVKYLHDGGDYSDYEEVVVTNRVKAGEYYLELCDLDVLAVEV